MMKSMKQFALVLMLVLASWSSVDAFTSNKPVYLTNAATMPGQKSPNDTALMARNPFNYNEGQSPWGLIGFQMQQAPQGVHSTFRHVAL